ncbi:DNA-binding response regulator, NarL/FixJ family, contains REC and HTH domains [Actinokineospora alba]|uniref:DNA-binding response regulator, NarL/FixJ family, contains REC and HTH domains n=1 Tax=Actinokineospora alba TaxID=504798 RepID=A0A1H0HUV6_9PSEU|nr:response regulator transcription factor [Actinokineospora alba]TDP64735.1 LuxR family two component transcriptional regulator [Actinokineospora alba]SDH44459.1 DNA-binding response regulator, NarL/FixJ family, contains REC and HTH domains [Actinokineospora alba]SDO22938.1 DNA-binding response regulator, NarL/FixJ family, contains REC and HTH domains [Actinokineospora alba]
MTDDIKVLIVDDHPVVRQGLRTFLDLQDDITVIGEAFDGASCVAEAERLNPDVILLDLRMPGTDGVFALRGLRDRANPARVLVITSFADPSAIVPAVRAGAAGYVYKDVDPRALAAAIRSVHAGHVLLHPDVARLLAEGDSRPSDLKLTSRESEVLEAVVRGLSNREIAKKFDLSEKTVKSHMSAILAKLGLQDRTQAALYAVRTGLVSLAGK